jgi:hypothetical protein
MSMLEIRKASFLGVIASAMLASGCSSITADGTSQNISVLTFAEDNQDIVGAKCELANDEGMWTTVTPNSVMVHRSNKDLQVNCKKLGHKDGRATLVSKTKANMFGNIIFGGGVGAIIDHNNGSAYEYPPTVKITMGNK